MNIDALIGSIKDPEVSESRRVVRGGMEGPQLVRELWQGSVLWTCVVANGNSRYRIRVQALPEIEWYRGRSLSSQ